MSGHALVVGAGGGIGAALVEHWSHQGFERVWAVSRQGGPHGPASVEALSTDHSESSIRRVVEQITDSGTELRRVAICLGTLHGPGYGPEKSLEALSAVNMTEVHRVNCVLPLLWIAALTRALRRNPDCRIVVLSARVGSIADNRLGGWYSYRSAKAGLNMGLKCAAIELARRAKGVKLIAFHPGTVDTQLSKPFQRGVPEHKLFRAEFVATRLAEVLDANVADGQLSYLDWDQKPIPW